MQIILTAFIACLFHLANTMPVKAESNRLEQAIEEAFTDARLAGLHAVYIEQDNRVLAELYFTGTDESWGVPLGERPFGPHDLHDIRSVTKSIVGLLYGIALEEGIVPPLDAPLMAQFPHYADLAGDPRRAGLKVEHALTMTLGLAWDESLPYTDPRNSEIAMEQAPDRYRYILEQDIVHEPGTTWTYSGGAAAIIGYLIERGSGLSLDEYARTRLFEPLGIRAFQWIRGSTDNRPSPASGLRLTPRALGLIGRMILNDGKVDDRQVVPASWLAASFTPRVSMGDLDYGYLWYLAPGENEPAFVAGFGNGGQRLSINRSKGLVFVVLAGRYNDWSAWQIAATISRDYLTPYLDENRD